MVIKTKKYVKSRPELRFSQKTDNLGGFYHGKCKALNCRLFFSINFFWNGRFDGDFPFPRSS